MRILILRWKSACKYVWGTPCNMGQREATRVLHKHLYARTQTRTHIRELTSINRRQPVCVSVCMCVSVPLLEVYWTDGATCVRFMTFSRPSAFHPTSPRSSRSFIHSLPSCWVVLRLIWLDLTVWFLLTFTCVHYHLSSLLNLKDILKNTLRQDLPQK